MKIHVNRDGNEVGVYAPAELKRGLEQGEVKPEDLAWVEGKTNWMPVSELPEEFLKPVAPPPLNASVPRLPPPVYHPVPVARYIICSIASMGLYQLYWFYRNWEYVRRRDRRRIWPFWRTVFMPIWTFFLVRDVERTAGVRTSQALWVTLLFLALCLSGQLPQPYLFLNIFAFWPFVYVVRHIGRLNSERMRLVNEPVLDRRHIVVCAVGLPVLLLATAVNFNIMPQPKILLGEELAESQLAYLRKAGILEENEQVLFLHRAGVFSIAEMGQLLTDKRVINYRLDELRKTVVESVALVKVKDVRVERPEQLERQTKLEVITGERVYVFGLSRNDDRDVAFEEELKRRVVEEQKQETP